MAKKSFTLRKIIQKLRKVEFKESKGMLQQECIRQIGITE